MTELDGFVSVLVSEIFTAERVCSFVSENVSPVAVAVMSAVEVREILLDCVVDNDAEASGVPETVLLSPAVMDAEIVGEFSEMEYEFVTLPLIVPPEPDSESETVR